MVKSHPEKQNGRRLKRTASAAEGYQSYSYVWIVGVVILCGLLMLLCVRYLGYVRATIRQDARSSLAEMGTHIADSLDREIESVDDGLGAIALELSENDIRSETELADFLRRQADYWEFYDLAAIDNRGVIYHADGSVDAPVNREMLSKALAGAETVCDFNREGDEDCIVFCTPLAEEARERAGYSALAASYAVRDWNTFMEISVYDGKARTQVLTKNGAVVAAGEGQDGGDERSLLDSLTYAQFEDGVTLGQVKENLRRGISQQVSYRQDGEACYFNSEPLHVNDWAFAYTVPAGTVSSAGENMTRSVLGISAFLTAGFLLILLLFRLSHQKARKAMWRAAYVDEVTGGANKNRFEQDALALLERERKGYVLVYTNIYQFKLVNQRFGKDEANRLLKSLYAAMENMMMDQECCGRLSADNFVLLLKERREQPVAARLRTFAAQHALHTTESGAVCPVRLLFGLCRFEGEPADLTQVVDRANMAMKSLKTGSEAGMAVYDAAMLERAEQEKEMTEQLLLPDVRQEFYICLQPKVDLTTGRVVGAEALARWNSRVFGAVPPSVFIPLAEKVGAVCQIDWGAFESVCRVLSRWQEESRPLVPISFNLSKAQLEQPDFLDYYREIIRRYNVPCEYLDFEFTESLLYENSQVLQQAVAEIHAMGCLCSVDDFGFGYSSLGLLGQFDADTLKLDRSFFTGEAGADSRNNRIINSVIQMAGSLGMHTVAEGVEDADHVEMLRRFGCGAVQGYVFAPPIAVRDFEIYADKRGWKCG